MWYASLSKALVLKAERKDNSDGITIFGLFLLISSTKIYINLQTSMERQSKSMVVNESSYQPFSCHSQQLLSSLSSAYVLRKPILQTMWAQIRLLQSGFIVFAYMIKLVRKAHEFK